MVSFDVTSVYTNIPITDTLNIIKDYVNNDDQFTRKMAIPQDKFLDLFNTITLISCTAQFLLICKFYCFRLCLHILFEYVQHHHLH